MKERVLVTGALGFIGSHIVDLLIARGYEVAGLDKKPRDGIKFLNSHARYFSGTDISKKEQLGWSFASFKPDYVIHCAAEARIQPSFENPDFYFLSNVYGTRNLLFFAKKFGVKRVIYSASSSAYGFQKRLPIRENRLLASQALHPYGSTKRMGEMLMCDLGKATGGPETVCLRYFNVYGPRQATLKEGPYATVIGIFLDQIKGGLPFTIIPDGCQRRDFTWVGDVAEANFLAMTSLKVGGAEIINIGAGKSYSMWEIAELIAGKKDYEWEWADERKGEIKETLADISKAKRLLDWEPKVSLEEGIKLTKK